MYMYLRYVSLEKSVSHPILASSSYVPQFVTLLFYLEIWLPEVLKLTLFKACQAFKIHGPHLTRSPKVVSALHGNSHLIRDHTVLPATRHRRRSGIVCSRSRDDLSVSKSRSCTEDLQECLVNKTLCSAGDKCVAAELYPMWQKATIGDVCCWQQRRHYRHEWTNNVYIP